MYKKIMTSVFVMFFSVYMLEGCADKTGALSHIQTGAAEKKKIVETVYQTETEYQTEKECQTETEYQTETQSEEVQILQGEEPKIETKECLLPMENIKQEPELPTGCESVALTMVLNYYGFELDKTTIADDYLIYSDSFVTGYMGDPHTDNGAGIFPPGLTDTANEFLEEKESSLEASDISGTSSEELYDYVANGTPVIIWNVMHMTDAQLSDEIEEYEGKIYQWYFNEHCVVFCGYDKDRNIVWINDSLDGLVERYADEFWNYYDETGQNAIVIK